MDVNDREALDAIMQEFKPLVKAKAKAYFLLGGDLEDLIQEGMIGLYKAVLDYEPEKNTSFAAFASLCIVRQIQTAIKSAARQKHMPLNTSISLSDGTGQEPLLESLRDRHENDPETLFLGMETYNNIDEFIHQNLSPQEHKVLTMHMEGKSQACIAESIGKNVKSVDNTLQRIRRKIRTAIDIL